MKLHRIVVEEVYYGSGIQLPTAGRSRWWEREAPINAIATEMFVALITGDVAGGR
jgi:hypothetical protein